VVNEANEANEENEENEANEIERWPVVLMTKDGRTV
jgi:hypothetical protein